jgi:Flp pilus assembly protein TadG
MLRFRILHRGTVSLMKDVQAAALLEFAIVLPLLIVFVVGIFDFSGAFNQKQKIEQAAQEGAIIAGAQPMSDITSGNGDPDSLHPVVTAVFNSLAGSGVLTKGTCVPPGTAVHVGSSSNLKWRYTISPCPDDLVVVIDRGWVATSATSTSTTAAVGTIVTVTYPYHWRFNSVIQLLFPGAKYADTPKLTESATVHNQM